jgi:hypothetical protein
MRPLRAQRATIVPVPALVDRKMDADRKVDVGPKVVAGQKTDAVRKVVAGLKAVAVPKVGAVRKTGAVPKAAAAPDDVRSRAWSSLSVRRSPVARLTWRGSRLQAFQFGRLRRQNHVADLVAKDPMAPVAD